MTGKQWFLWALGCVASIVVLSAFAFGKGAPSWYPPLFLVAAAYCLVATGFAVRFRRMTRMGNDRASSAEALSTAELGFVALVGIVVVFAILFVLRVGR
jgi:hypothetical protein